MAPVSSTDSRGNRRSRPGRGAVPPTPETSGPRPPSDGDQTFSRRVWAIVGLAFAVRLWHVWQISGSPFFDVLLGDAKGYDAWARRLAAGDWIGNDVFYQAPLYPYVLGVIYRVAGHSLLTVRVAQALLGAGACGLLAISTKRFLGATTGLIAGLALSLYAPAIFFDGLLQKSSLDTACLTCALWMASGLLDDDAFEPASRRQWFGLGFALGALSLTRENALVFVAVAAAWIGVRRMSRPVPSGHRAWAGGALALGVLVLVAPVAVRNAAVGGGFYLTTSQFGPNFYIGNNPNADGSYAPLRFGRGAPEYERVDATTLAEHATGRSLTPGDVSTYWTSRGLAFITEQPGRWLALMGRKALLLVNAREMLDTESQESYAVWSLPLRLLGWFGHFGVLVPLALLGAILAWPTRHRVGLLYAMTALYAASVLVFYVFARYRLPLVPLLLPFAAEALVWAGRRAQHRPDGRHLPAWAFVVTALVAVPANWPLLSGPLMQAITETNLATELQAASRFDDAIAHYRQAIALQADYAPAYNNLGVALRAQGRTTDAIDTYRQALALHGDYPDAHYNLANALLAQGDAVDAEAHFSIALRAIPDEAGIRNNLAIALAQQGKPDEALAAMRAAVAAAPDSAIAHRNLGDLLVAAGRVSEGLAALERATQLDPTDPSAHYNLGVALLDAERLDQAVVQFQKTLALTPDSEDAHNNLGIALGALGRVAESDAQFRAALAVNPQSAEARKNLALLQELLRQRDRASQRK